MRPVDKKFKINQPFGAMATAGVIGNVNASQDTAEYYVGLYGNYQPFGHAGADFECPIGTPIYAIAAGTVLYAGWSDDLPGDDSWGPSGFFRRWALMKNFAGIVTVIQHNGWISVTAHQSTNDMVHVGMHVKEGQLIGKSGNTSSRNTRLAPHVHIEALIDLNYPSTNGLIYGRTNPEHFFGTATPTKENTVATAPEVWNVRLQEYKSDGKSKAGVKTAAFILGNLNQWVGRILDIGYKNLAETKAVRAEVAALRKALAK